MRHYMMTAHQQFVGSGVGGPAVQLKYTEDIRDRLVVLPDVYDTVLTDGPLMGSCMLKSGENTVSFIKDGRFLCAVPSRRELVHNRTKIGLWEQFVIVSEEELSRFENPNVPPEQEIARFAKTVSWHIAHQKPVKLHLGCGTRPRPGFLNLDRSVRAPAFFVSNQDEYFVFPYADGPWGLPDNSVDYIFHEDFIEHIPQLQQIQILAEGLRVLKPGQYHRVNTPNLLTAMKRNSDFGKGFVGVYTGEMKWGHASLFSPFSLKEIAEMIGYRDVVFTTKNHGVSAFSEQDSRPGADRDEIFGNIFADLLK
jgi:hypothetical protein